METFLSTYQIGSHMQKKKTLLQTVKDIPFDTGKPAQIFISNPQSTKVSINQEDLHQTSLYLLSIKPHPKLFIHSPFIINLSYEPGTSNDYPVVCLQETLKAAARGGAKGVVVHVGKSTKLDPDIALENMFTNIEKALEAATPNCPLLLETPAGQGTELLTTYDEFLAFVQTVDHPNLKICVDTCHVFATGQCPLAYLQALLEDAPELLTLVHYNDSKECCGSCKDRHAFVGEGEIGLTKMTEIAKLCSKNNVPMVIE
jgi:deoxyribonuclease-4